MPHPHPHTEGSAAHDTHMFSQAWMILQAASDSTASNGVSVFTRMATEAQGSDISTQLSSPAPQTFPLPQLPFLGASKVPWAHVRPRSYLGEGKPHPPRTRTPQHLAQQALSKPLLGVPDRPVWLSHAGALWHFSSVPLPLRSGQTQRCLEHLREAGLSKTATHNPTFTPHSGPSSSSHSRSLGQKNHHCHTAPHIKAEVTHSSHSVWILSRTPCLGAGKAGHSAGPLFQRAAR